jgi:hypothetical protein
MRPKFPFQLARHKLVRPVIVAVRNHPHAVEVDPRPDNVAMLAPFFLMRHHGARLPHQSEFFFQPVNRRHPLFRRQMLVGPRVDRSVIKRLLAIGTGRGDPSI